MRVPNWYKFPIIGSFGGEGGEFFFAKLLLVFNFDNKRLAMVVNNASINRKNHKEVVPFRKFDIDFCMCFKIVMLSNNITCWFTTSCM